MSKTPLHSKEHSGTVAVSVNYRIVRKWAWFHWSTLGKTVPVFQRPCRKQNIPFNLHWEKERREGVCVRACVCARACVLRERYYRRDMKKDFLQMASASTGRDDECYIPHHTLVRTLMFNQWTNDWETWTGKPQRQDTREHLVLTANSSHSQEIFWGNFDK